MKHTLDSRSCIDLEDRYSAHNYHPLDVVLARGEGAHVWDVEGRRYLDCLAAYSAVNQGHNHPAIVAALTEQAQVLALTSRAFRNDRFGPFCEKLATWTGYDRVLMMNTGAEAVETAIKAARRWGSPPLHESGCRCRTCGTSCAEPARRPSRRGSGTWLCSCRREISSGPGAWGDVSRGAQSSAIRCSLMPCRVSSSGELPSARSHISMALYLKPAR